MVSVFLSAQPATAQESGDPTRALQNLVYYPHAGQFNLTPGYTMNLNSSSQTQNDVGTETNSSVTHLYEITGNLNYGVVDRWRLGVSDDYTIDSSNNQTNTNTGVVTTSHSRGLSDPHIVGAYRFIENQESKFYADLSLNVGVKTGPAVNADSVIDRTGNQASGNWNLTLSVPFYWILGSNELGLTLQEEHFFGTTAYGNTNVNTGATSVIDTSPYWTTEVLIQDRFHFLERWYINPQVTFDFNTTNTAQIDGQTTSTGHDIGFHVIPAISVGYLAAEWCLVTLNVSYTNDKNTATPSASTSSDALVNTTQASLQARFQF
jgi:hypothetical protein